MAHSVGEQAARAVKNSERKKIEEKRTPEEIIKGIRGNLAAHLYVTPNDIQFLLAEYDLKYAAILQLQKNRDEANERYDVLLETNVRLNEQVEQFRTVYEQENRSTTVKVERVIDPNQDGIEAAAENGV